MFDNLTDLVKQYAGDAIINNPAIPNEHNDAAVATASSSIMDGLKNALSGGNMDSLSGFFNGGSDAAANTAIGQNIQAGFVENLMHKFGLDQGKAGAIAASLIPMVLKNFVHKTNDPNDSSFNLQDMMGSLTGGGGGILDKIKGMFN